MDWDIELVRIYLKGTTEGGEGSPFFHLDGCVGEVVGTALGGVPRSCGSLEEDCTLGECRRISLSRDSVELLVGGVYAVNGERCRSVGEEHTARKVSVLGDLDLLPRASLYDTHTLEQGSLAGDLVDRDRRKGRDYGASRETRESRLNLPRGGSPSLRDTARERACTRFRHT